MRGIWKKMCLKGLHSCWIYCDIIFVEGSMHVTIIILDLLFVTKNITTLLSVIIYKMPDVNT